MHASRFVALVALGSSLALLSACGSATEPAQSAQSAVTRAPLTAASQTRGPGKVIAEAFADVPLRADQRATLEQMFKEAGARHEPVQKAHADLTLALAQQVEAGTLDRAALQPRLDAIAAQWTQSEDQDRAALVRAHDLLDPDQRVALMNALEAKFMEKRAEHMGPGAGHERGAGMGHGPGMGMMGMADELKLTEEQRGKIQEAMHAQFAKAGDQHEGPDGPGADHEHHAGHMGDMKARWEKFKAAFVSDHFTAEDAMPKKDAQERMQKMTGHMLDMVAIALPVLTPEQRTLAAAKLRERAAAPQDAQ